MFRFACPAQIHRRRSAPRPTLSWPAQLGVFPRATNQDVGFGKIDYQLTPRNHVSASFDLMNYHAPNAYSTSPSYNNRSVTTNGSLRLPRAHLRGELGFHAISNTVVNNLRFQWGRDLEVAGPTRPRPSVSIASVMTYGDA